VWNALMEHIDYFPPQFRQAYYTIFLDEYEKEKLRSKSREDQCVELFQRNEQLNVVLGSMFIEKYFSNESNSEVYVEIITVISKNILMTAGKLHVHQLSTEKNATNNTTNKLHN
jgi:hypothetical protein